MTAAFFALGVCTRRARAAIRATVTDRRYSRLVNCWFSFCSAASRLAIVSLNRRRSRLRLGKLYQGFFYDGPSRSNEHDVTPEDVARYEQAVGKKTAWVFFSNNWLESRKFPAQTCDWIRGLGKVPYVRLMLRSDAEQNQPEKTFSLGQHSSRRI